MLGKCRKSIISALEPFSAVLGLLGDLGDVPRPRDLPGVPPACRAASRHPPATRRGSPPSIPPLPLPLEFPGPILGSNIRIFGPDFLRFRSIHLKVCTAYFTWASCALDRPVWAVCWQQHQDHILAQRVLAVRSRNVRCYGGFQVWRVRI